MNQTRKVFTREGRVSQVQFWAPDQLRIRELERELAIAREDPDILKKATVRSTGQCNTI